MSNIITTPRGTAAYPYLNTPDTKFNPDGDYKVTLVLDADSEDTQALLAKLDEAHAAAVAKAKKENAGKKIKTADLSVDSESEPGKVKVSFKLKARVSPKNGKAFTQKPALFDAAGKPMSKDIYGGSEIKVAFEPIPFYTATVGAGVTLRLKAVQVIKLSTSAQKGGSAFGFGAEEGYVDDGVAQESPFAETSEEEETTTDGDF